MNYERISIGDVGFIRDGQFLLLFSAGRTREEQPAVTEFPDYFEPMEPGATVASSTEPMLPGNLHTDTVEQFKLDGKIGLPASTNLYVWSPKPPSPFRPL